MRRAHFLAVAGLVVAACLAAPGAVGQPAQCTKADFETVVDEAAGALVGLTHQNTPTFQGKLRQLKGKRGWSDARFLKEAEPLVLDEKIADFDRQSEDLLRRITHGGQEAGSTEGPPDCALLGGLRAAMATLLETQKAKWAYMFQKIDAELSK
jgi:hypothetical protein